VGFAAVAGGQPVVAQPVVAEVGQHVGAALVQGAHRFHLLGWEARVALGAGAVSVTGQAIPITAASHRLAAVVRL
jgi:hypothetical protein